MTLSKCECNLKINDSDTVIGSFDDHKHNKPDEKNFEPTKN